MDVLVIRTDSNPDLGSGHAMRCLALAQAWRDDGGLVTFVMSAPAPALKKRLQTEGIDVYPLKAAAASAEDAAETAALAREKKSGWLVIDGYSFTAEYQRRVRNASIRQMVIDDPGGIFDCDLLLNQNLHAVPEMYSKMPASGTEFLLGTRYALLRREFREAERGEAPVPSRAQHLLILTGGGNPGRIQQQIVDALRNYPEPDFNMLMIGAGLSEAEIRDAGRVRIETQTTEMPARMRWAHFALSGAGSTCWELAYLGVPALLMVLAANQKPVAESLETAGACINLGAAPRLQPAALQQAIRHLANSPDTRLAMATQARRLVDGQGAGRAVMRLRGERLRLRPVQTEDCRMLWEWANDAEVRQASFSNQPIPLETHEIWFGKKLAEKPVNFWLALDNEDRPAGQIRLESDGRKSFMSLMVKREMRGQGLGVEMIRLACRRFFALNSRSELHAYIKPDNKASLAAFRQAGFETGGTAKIKGIEAMDLILAGKPL